MTEKVVVLGATGGCLDTIELVLDINLSLDSPIEIIGVLDDNVDKGPLGYSGLKVLGGFGLLNEIPEEIKVVNALGSDENFHRKENLIMNVLGLQPSRLKTLVHPEATVASNVTVGNGTLVYQHSTLGRSVNLGVNTVVLPNNFIGHDTTIGDFTTINAGCNISGYCSIGSSCYLGTGTSIKTHAVVEDNCLIGMGSNVITDVKHCSVVFGNPAKVRGTIEA